MFYGIIVLIGVKICFVEKIFVGMIRRNKGKGNKYNLIFILL